MLLLALAQLAFAQAPEAAPAMADDLRASGKIYVVVAVVAIIVAGLLALPHRPRPQGEPPGKRNKELAGHPSPSRLVVTTPSPYHLKNCPVTAPFTKSVKPA